MKIWLLKQKGTEGFLDVFDKEDYTPKTLKKKV